MARRKVLEGLVFSAVLCVLAHAGAWAQVPPHLDILSCGIEEVPPIDRENVAGRVVLLRVEVNGAPICGPATGHLAYGFLIDSDSDPATGSPTPAFGPLGVDARISAVCDPVSGSFVSRVGTVSVVSGPGTTTFEIQTTVQQLPALEFRWIAFAQEGPVLSRLPQLPEYGHWLTHEKGVY